ncbi:hypothetical protein SY83_09160 [Paenibacillus swuensis]|uniref:HAMP domain-containing protein n=2 Tax=Paenibacillus swuensis TaxID=1178515 RepID=A0A172TP74_9BACL|nr:hypothetical protein SY83_09160 [Paenibacillus swuensis]
MLSVRKRLYVPFAYKIMVPYLLLMLLTDALIGYFSYTAALDSKEEYIRTNMERTLRQIRDNTEYQIGDMDRISEQLFNSLTLQRLLQSNESDYQIYNNTVNTLLPQLESTLKLSVNNIRLNLYVQNEKLKEIYSPETLEDPFIQGKQLNIYHMSRIVNEPWYLKLEEGHMGTEWSQIGTDQERGNISTLRKLISFDKYGATIGYLRITTGLKDLFQSVDSFTLSEGTNVMVLLEADDSVLYSKMRQAISDEPSHLAMPGQLTIKEPLPGTPWKLVAVVPEAELRKDVQAIRNFTILVCTVSFIVMAGLGLLVARYFARKVGKLVSLITSFQGGEFGKRVRFTSNDEFASIAGAFNGMAQNIEELIQEVYVKNIQKKEAELESLQAQINPHFLYNTLSSINSLANLGEVENLSRMVSGLAKFYRLTLNDGNMLISLDKELQQVKAYIDIQTIKYGDRFEASYDIDEQLLCCETIKLILQPFVENVLKHAWFEERIHIRIVIAQEDGKVIIKVIDNGIGMNTARFHAGLTPQGIPSGYGIRNVEERIQLQYGPDYGVHMYSRPGIGTTVKLTLPHKKQ